MCNSRAQEQGERLVCYHLAKPLCGLKQSKTRDRIIRGGRNINRPQIQLLLTYVLSEDGVISRDEHHVLLSRPVRSSINPLLPGLMAQIWTSAVWMGLNKSIGFFVRCAMFFKSILVPGGSVELALKPLCSYATLWGISRTVYTLYVCARTCGLKVFWGSRSLWKPYGAYMLSLGGKRRPYWTSYQRPTLECIKWKTLIGIGYYKHMVSNHQPWL